MKKHCAILCGILMLLFLLPQSSEALLICGSGTWGSFEGSLTYTYTGCPTKGEAILEFVLKNTSPLANGGYLTKFVFNNPGGNIAGISTMFTDPDFCLLGGPSFSNDVNLSPFGYFDVGAAISGNPSKGIGVGTTETFTFELTGTNLNVLDEWSFVNELSVPPGAGEGVRSFVARFQGFENGESDKVPGDYNTPIPEPGSLLLLGSGFFGLGAFSWFRRRKH